MGILPATAGGKAEELKRVSPQRAAVAQLAERLLGKEQVEGSNPSRGSITHRPASISPSNVSPSRAASRGNVAATPNHLGEAAALERARGRPEHALVHGR